MDIEVIKQRRDQYIAQQQDLRRTAEELQQLLEIKERQIIAFGGAIEALNELIVAAGGS